MGKAKKVLSKNVVGISNSLNDLNLFNVDNQKLIVNTIDDWVYTTPHRDVFKNKGDILNHIIKCTEDSILSTYLQLTAISRIDDDIVQYFSNRKYTDNDIYAIFGKMNASYHRLINKEKIKDFKIRIESKDNVYVIRYIDSVNIDDNEPDKIVHVFCFIDYDNKNSVVTYRTLSFYNHYDYYTEIPRLNESFSYGFFYSDDSSNARRYARKLVTNYSSEILKTMKIMTYAFRTFMDSDTINIFDAPVHNSIEMSLFRKFIKINRYSNIDDLNWIPLSITKRVNTDNSNSNAYNELYPTKKYTEVVSQILSFRDYPIVDLNNKEYAFIYKFCLDKGYITYEDEKDFCNIDIIEFLRNPRYGNTLKIHPDFKSGIELDPEDNKLLTIRYDLDIDNDILSIHILYEDENFVIDDIFNFTDLKNFSIKYSMYDYRVDVYLHPDTLPLSYDEIFRNSPVVLTDLDSMICLLYDIIMMYIVAHLRPARTKMVKITEHKPKLHPHFDDPEDDDIVITHLLKTATDAKNYIKTMTEKTGCIVKREYVIEEWHRMGHFRTLKSGKSIWIPPTTCHRNQPLTEKEVHIKL